jgi:acyl carrier protein
MREHEFIQVVSQLHVEASVEWLGMSIDELPLDSLDLLTLTLILEQEYQVTILDVKFPPRMTLADIYEYVK